ncbi:zinc-binding dehydrogenase [Lindgomyces ingoldianus]|uniref:Zinc-binding dehydrogenase n=1 Tax=Lindgomyces ingoldianus TaxID=673940 RepID=A0ACB6R2V2_9PLEO|nr:zinc-binding dehydrogenase [Lindgomyces ingoldianus]KAF2473593.1 zinc-binding dehydrogenase [Lindgomyces ingoldianus]
MATSTIRKALITGTGDLSNVQIVTATIAPPPPNHVQVKVLYSGFSGADINMRLGIYPNQKKAPLTPGYCFVGRVHVNGSDCKKFTPGDLVVCLSVYDAEAELANMPEKYLVPVPAGLDIQQAVALTLDWNTAYGMVYRTAKVTKGQRVFIHGLSGAVGYALMKLCQLEGAEVYGTASQSNHAALRNEGAIPFVYSNKDWIMAMNAIGGAHAAFDALGFESWDESFSILAPEGGHLVGFGGNLPMLTGGKHRSVIPAVTKLLARNMVPFCPNKTSFYYIGRDQSTFEPELKKLFEMSREGKIHVPIRKIWELEEVPEAHRTWNSAGGIGSVLVRVAEDDGKA